jgi:FkbM family methyltransferase
MVFSSIRFGSSLRRIHVSRLSREVVFRSAADHGVMAHFFYPQTRIVDSEDNPVRTVVDAGANIGIETIRMRHFYPEATILAIEADRGNFSVLLENIRDDPKTLAWNNGLWSSNTELSILNGGNNQAFSVVPTKPGGKPDLEAVTMETILKHLGGKIDILKMDIEGAEYEIFGENTGWVQHLKVLIVECPDHDKPGASQRIFRALAHLPFNMFISGENLVFIRETVGWKVITTSYL